MAGVMQVAMDARLTPQEWFAGKRLSVINAVQAEKRLAKLQPRCHLLTKQTCALANVDNREFLFVPQRDHWIYARCSARGNQACECRGNAQHDDHAADRYWIRYRHREHLTANRNSQRKTAP